MKCGARLEPQAQNDGLQMIKVGGNLALLCSDHAILPSQAHVVMAPDKKGRKYPKEWTDWGWDDTRKCNYRAREIAKGILIN